MIHRSSILFLSVLAIQAFGQTTTPTALNLQTQGRNPDFSGFTFTRPVSVGTSLPSTCQVGQLFFNSSATAGANLYACTASNTWTLETGGGSGSSVGASMAAQLGDFNVTLSSNTITIGTSCSATTPCNMRIGNTVYRFTSPATIAPSGSASGMVYIYIDNGGNLTAGSSVSLTCSSCTYASGVSAFPAGSIPLFTWSVSNGAFNSGGSTDFRAWLSTKNLIGGSGVVVTENAGTSTISVDTTLVSTFLATAPATSSSSCTIGQFSVDSTYFYVCIPGGTWKRVALGTF